MNWQTAYQFVTTHWVVSSIAAIVVFYVGLAFLTSLYKRYDFYCWYFVIVVVALVGAVGTRWNLYCVAFLLGMTTAFAEIISKFKDEPIKTLGMPHALFYHLLNGSIAAFALKILILFGASIATPQDQMKTVLFAGLGSMLVMRSKFFNIKVGGEDIAFGPEQIIKIFFRFMEAAIDRQRAQSRIDFVKAQLGSINPDKVFKYSVTMLLASQALEEKTRNDLLDSIEELHTGKLKDEQARLKAYRLGFLLLDSMGEAFVAKLFEKVPPDWLMEAPAQEKKEGSIVDKLGTLPFFPAADEKAKLTPYLAYGTSMCSRVFRARLGQRWSEMDETKFREATTPTRCILNGYRLVFHAGRSESKELGLENITLGLANIVECEPQDFVEGVLYYLAGEVIEFLDTTEPGYHRERVVVEVDGAPIEAQAYIAELRRDGNAPDRNYLQCILDGAREFGLSLEYQQQIKEVAKAAKVEADLDSGTKED